MLMLTESASKVIGALAAHPELPEGAGLRITTAPEGLTVAPAGGPEATDEVIEDQNARVFMEPDAAVVLSDKVLDATVDDDGRVQFMLAEQ